MATHEAVPQRLYLFSLSTTTIAVGPRMLDMVSGCYLVEMSDGKRILIDSGYPNDVPPSPGMSASDQDKNVLQCLAELGLGPDNIDMLICTHFDVDHAGYHDAFPAAELIVQREHYELARSGHPRFAPARKHWDDPALRYRLVDGDTELFPGLTLLETSGHTAGHQSVLVRLPKTGPVLLAIDAVMLQFMFTPARKAGPIDDNEDQLRASTQKLLDLIEQEHIKLVIFGHDGAQWKTLKTSPAYYE
ncbi:MBL fold metallo-hydrolase [Dictyobacter alpinus]|uniref:MBL fold metallo-hydrolase n=1 Tax=Dictyobacter alpinus TaxID=2014873 RepID=A0A402BBW5_9CHLR|nr:N-acyl homoserine lactonase family protein [Dictyobacter alpinus]GCE28767.1 MBL fold metallo-hydrolase [Dictyobacter alpinus]